MLNQLKIKGTSYEDAQGLKQDYDAVVHEPA